jgi:hypothetical protein
VEKALSKQLYIGKESITLLPAFLSMSYTQKCIKEELGRRVNDQVMNHIMQQLETVVQYKCHSDYVSQLPREAHLLGTSKRIENEIFGIGN